MVIDRLLVLSVVHRYMFGSGIAPTRSCTCPPCETQTAGGALPSLRVHVAGLNKGGMDTFVDNLPGFPDNIRPSSSGGYWVSMAAVRANPGFSMLDFLSQRPWIKKLIFKVETLRLLLLSFIAALFMQLSFSFSELCLWRLHSFFYTLKMLIKHMELLCVWNVLYE